MLMGWVMIEISCLVVFVAFCVLVELGADVARGFDFSLPVID